MKKLVQFAKIYKMKVIEICRFELSIVNHFRCIYITCAYFAKIYNMKSNRNLPIFVVYSEAFSMHIYHLCIFCCGLIIKDFFILGRNLH